MNFHKDDKIKFDYNPVLDAQIEYLNAVGATDSMTLRTLDFTPADANTIFVAKTGNDSTGTGTQASPVLTIKKAESLITATKINIVIMDDGVYEEESLAFDTNCVNIAAALGKKPTVKPKFVLGSNYLIETVKDTTALTATAGKYLRKIKTISLSNGNFLLYYNNGESTAIASKSWFIIIDKDGNVVNSETAVGTSNVGEIQGCPLEGYFVLTWRDMGSNVLCINVYNNSGVLSYSESSIGCDTNCSGVGKFALYDDVNQVPLNSVRFAVLYYTSSNTYYVVKDVDGTTRINPTILTSYNNGGGYSSVVPRTKGGFLWSFDNSICVWGVINQSGTVLNYATFGSGAKSCLIVENKLDTDLATIVYTTSGNVLYIVEYSLTTFTVTKTATLLLSSIAYAESFDAFDTGKFVIGTQYSTTLDMLILDSDWSVLLHETYTTATAISAMYNYYCDRLAIAWINYADPYMPRFKIKGGFITDWWTFSSSITFNGLIFDNNEDRIRRYLYDSSGTFKFKWCNFLNIARTNYNDSGRYPLYIAELTVTAAEILNCQVFNNNAGFKITSNSVLVQTNQFYKQLLNSAIYVIGAGSGIIVNHNDFLYNYIGVELEDNNGSEVLKNNIYHTSLLYSIKAETAVTYINSVENGVSFNATAGAQVIRSNPHYINDGYVSLAVMDLVLKSRELGYRFESPAIGIGDDLKNAGSLEYEVAGGSQTWDTITVIKPSIKRGYNPVGAIETPYKNGSVETYRDSYTEVLKLEWDSLEEDDFLELMNLYFCGNNLARVYLDPEREPGTYGTYVLIYDKVNASAKNWQFDDIGKNDFDLTFKRAYNEGI